MNSTDYVKNGMPFRSMDDVKLYFDEFVKHGEYRAGVTMRGWQDTPAISDELGNALSGKSSINSLLMGCSYWENPMSVYSMLRKYNKDAELLIAVLDAYPFAMQEALEKINIQEMEGAVYLPLVAFAQNTPFLDNYFDLLISDGMINCCDFSQHKAINNEERRILKPDGRLVCEVLYTPEEVGRKVERELVDHIEMSVSPLSEVQQLFDETGLVILPHTMTKYEFDFKPGNFGASFVCGCKE
jgi:SAM-dependent methyltransferase